MRVAVPLWREAQAASDELLGPDSRRAPAGRPAGGDPHVSERVVRTSSLALFAVLLAGLAYYGARGSLANFVLSWESAYDESRGSISLIATASFLSIGIAQVVGGKLLERVAAWKVLAVGLALGVGGYLLGALAPSLPIAILGSASSPASAAGWPRTRRCRCSSRSCSASGTAPSSASSAPPPRPARS